MRFSPAVKAGPEVLSGRSLEGRLIKMLVQLDFGLGIRPRLGIGRLGPSPMPIRTPLPI